MLATIVFERLPCKPNLFVHNLLLLIAKIYVERKFVFATRTDYIRCPHVCVRILQAVRMIFEEVSDHAAYHPVTRVRLAIGRRGHQNVRSVAEMPGRRLANTEPAQCCRFSVSKQS
jgi:hypothetical protein